MDRAARQTKFVPAPLIVVFCLLGGSLVHVFRPVRLLPDIGIIAPLLGIGLGALALSIGVTAVRQFHSHHTPTSPFRPTTALVTSGVFSRTRNPMYLSFVMLTLGVALAINSLALFVAAVLLAILLQLFVIAPEERFLSAAFGKQFETYRDRTRRWL